MSAPVKLSELVPGRVYRVELFDCCVGGEITGVYREPVLRDGDVVGCRFDFGWVDGSIEAREVDA